MNESKVLKQLRDASGLTLAQVARKAGFTTQTIWSAEQGDVSPVTATKIKKVLIMAVEARRAEANALLAKTAPAV